MSEVLNRRAKELRTRHGLSLRKLAKKAGCSTSFVWSIEKNPEMNPSLDHLRKVARVYGVSVAHFFQNQHNSAISDSDQELLIRGIIYITPLTKARESTTLRS